MNDKETQGTTPSASPALAPAGGSAKWGNLNRDDLKKSFDELYPRASILVWATRELTGERWLKYLFREWASFEAALPFSEIDAMRGIDVQVWEDDDSPNAPGERPEKQA